MSRQQIRRKDYSKPRTLPFPSSDPKLEEFATDKIGFRIYPVVENVLGFEVPRALVDISPYGHDTVAPEEVLKMGLKKDPRSRDGVRQVIHPFLRSYLEGNATVWNRTAPLYMPDGKTPAPPMPVYALKWTFDKAIEGKEPVFKLQPEDCPEPVTATPSFWLLTKAMSSVGTPERDGRFVACGIQPEAVAYAQGVIEQPGGCLIVRTPEHTEERVGGVLLADKYGQIERGYAIYLDKMAYRRISYVLLQHQFERKLRVKGQMQKFTFTGELDYWKNLYMSTIGLVRMDAATRDEDEGDEKAVATNLGAKMNAAGVTGQA